MKRLLSVLMLVAGAGWAAGCGDGAQEGTQKIPTEAEKARMMDQTKKMMPPEQMKTEQGSPAGAKEDGDEGKAKDEPGEDSTKDDGGDAGNADK
jgi:hypothetical protein